MRFIFLIFTFFSLTGVYGQIDEQHQAFRTLLTSQDKSEIDRISCRINANPDDFVPPVLFAYADFLYRKGEEEKSLFWYSLAQIRTMVDVQLTQEDFRNSAQETMNLYQSIFSRRLSDLAFKDLSRWGVIQKAALVYVQNHKEFYDRSWVFSDGNSRLFTEEELLILMKPEESYNRIKFEVIKGYALVTNKLFPVNLFFCTDF